MMDMLLHLVRNAVSHVVEPVEERAARGSRRKAKSPARATVGDNVLIEIGGRRARR